jgi:hypothetical protein
LGGSFKNSAGTFDIDLLAIGRIGYRFSNTDHGGEMKDVGDIPHGLGQEFSIENRALEKMAGQAGETISVSGGEIIENIDGSTGLEETNKVASNKACSPRDEKFHRRRIVPNS